MYFCPLCKEKKRFKAAKSLISHLRRYHFFISGTSVRCKQNGCSKTFKKLYNFSRHLERFHSKIECKSVEVLSVPTSTDVDRLKIEEKYLSSSKNKVVDSSFFDINAEALCSFLKSQPKIPSSSCNSIMELMSIQSKETFSFLSDKLTEIITMHNLDHKIFEPILKDFNCFSKGFDDYLNTNKIRKKIKKNEIFLEPTAIILGKRFETRFIKGNSKIKEVTDYCYYFNIKDVLGILFKCENLVEIILDYKNNVSSHQDLINVHDGTYLKSKDYKSNLFLEIFLDDVECCNPLGSNSGINQVCNISFSFKDLPLKHSSKLNLIFSVIFAYTIDVKRYGFEPILKNLISDLNELHSAGFLFSFKQRTINLKVSVFQFTGDNLGLNKLLGFMESFSSNYCCRICKQNKTERQVSVKDDTTKLRNRDDYFFCLDSLNQGEEAYGIKSDSPINKLTYFKVCDNIVLDIMHDFLEGVTNKIVCIVIKILCFEKKFFDLSWLNDLIINFNYGFIDCKDKPSPLKFDQINGSKKLSQKAIQMWCLVRYLPLMLGDKIPEYDETFQLLLIHLDIIDIIFSPVISIAETNELASLIEEHHKLYLSLDKNNKLTPKMHFMIHYPFVIRNLGPPIRYWCMRYEQSHSFIKQSIRSSNNRINIVKTASVKWSFKFFHLYKSKFLDFNIITTGL